MRRGFTLIELMISSVILIIVATAFASAIMGSSTLVSQAYQEAECSIQMRELRDRLLFHLAPSTGDTSWSGLLSATNSTGSYLVQSSTKLNANLALLTRHADGSVVVSGTDVRSQKQTISVSGSGDDRKLKNSYGDQRDRWLSPGGISLLSLPTGVKVFSREDGAGGTDEECYTIRIGYDNGKGFHRYERIVVPVFMRKQTSYGTSGTFSNGGKL